MKRIVYETTLGSNAIEPRNCVGVGNEPGTILIEHNEVGCPEPVATPAFVRGAIKQYHADYVLARQFLIDRAARCVAAKHADVGLALRQLREANALPQENA